MWEWGDQLKLGKSSAFVKKRLRLLPQAEVDFEADFFLDAASFSRRYEYCVGMVVERMFGGVLAMEDARYPPPTVNNLAALLAHAMLRPLNAHNHQQPRTIYLRDRPQWQELLPHLEQLGIHVVLSEDLPRFDEAVIEWMQCMKTKKLLSADEIKVTLRKPFPPRERTWFTDAMDLMEWTQAMCRGAYPPHKVAVPSYDPLSIVSIHLGADDLEAILTKTTISRTNKLRQRLETMATEDKAIELDVNAWTKLLLALCGASVEEMPVRKHLLGIARRIAEDLAEALGIDAPSPRT